MVTRIVKMTFKSDCVDLFLDKFDLIKEKVGGQVGCQSVRLVRDIKCNQIFFTISDWESEDDLNMYRQSPFFKDTWTTIKPWFGAKAEAWSTESVWPQNKHL